MSDAPMRADAGELARVAALDRACSREHVTAGCDEDDGSFERPPRRHVRSQPSDAPEEQTHGTHNPSGERLDARRDASDAFAALLADRKRTVSVGQVDG